MCQIYCPHRQDQLILNCCFIPCMHKTLATETFLRAESTDKMPKPYRERFSGRRKAGPLQDVVLECLCHTDTPNHTCNSSRNMVYLQFISKPLGLQGSFRTVAVVLKPALLRTQGSCSSRCCCLCLPLLKSWQMLVMSWIYL